MLLCNKYWVLLLVILCISGVSADLTFIEVDRNACSTAFQITLSCVTDTPGDLQIYSTTHQINERCELHENADPEVFEIKACSINEKIEIAFNADVVHDGSWECIYNFGSVIKRLDVNTAYPYFLSGITVSEGSRSAFVTICARNDTEVLWNDGDNDDFEIHNATSSEACGARDQLVMTSSIFKKTSGAHEFKVKLVSTSCESGERPTLSASCECGDITSGVSCSTMAPTTTTTVATEAEESTPAPTTTSSTTCPSLPAVTPCPTKSCDDNKNRVGSAPNPSGEDAASAEGKSGENCGKGLFSPLTIALLVGALIQAAIVAFLAKELKNLKKIPDAQDVEVKPPVSESSVATLPENPKPETDQPPAAAAEA